MSMSYCPLFSGSSGNAAIIGTEKTRILIDAGLTGRALQSALNQISVDPCSIQAILITHEHSDHVRGAGILSRKFGIPIYANSKTWVAMQKSVGVISPQNVRVFETGRDFYLGDCNITPYSLPHDAADPVGFSFYHKGHKISQMTDLGHVPKDLYDMVGDSDIILIESNHDIEKLANSARPAALKRRIRSKKGHLSNEDSAEACVKLAEMGCRRFILGHMSAEANTPRLAFEANSGILAQAGFVQKENVEIYLAYRDRACGIFRL